MDKWNAARVQLRNLGQSSCDVIHVAAAWCGPRAVGLVEAVMQNKVSS